MDGLPASTVLASAAAAVVGTAAAPKTAPFTQWFDAKLGVPHDKRAATVTAFVQALAYAPTSKPVRSYMNSQDDSKHGPSPDMERINIPSTNGGRLAMVMSTADDPQPVSAMLANRTPPTLGADVLSFLHELKRAKTPPPTPLSQQQQQQGTGADDHVSSSTAPVTPAHSAAQGSTSSVAAAAAKLLQSPVRIKSESLALVAAAAAATADAPTAVAQPLSHDDVGSVSSDGDELDEHAKALDELLGELGANESLSSIEDDHTSLILDEPQHASPVLNEPDTILTSPEASPVHQLFPIVGISVPAAAMSSVDNDDVDSAQDTDSSFTPPDGETLSSSEQLLEENDIDDGSASSTDGDSSNVFGDDADEDEDSAAAATQPEDGGNDDDSSISDDLVVPPVLVGTFIPPPKILRPQPVAAVTAPVPLVLAKPAAAPAPTNGECHAACSMALEAAYSLLVPEPGHFVADVDERRRLSNMFRSYFLKPESTVQQALVTGLAAIKARCTQDHYAATFGWMCAALHKRPERTFKFLAPQLVDDTEVLFCYREHALGSPVKQFTVSVPAKQMPYMLHVFRLSRITASIVDERQTQAVMVKYVGRALAALANTAALDKAFAC